MVGTYKRVVRIPSSSLREFYEIAEKKGWVVEENKSLDFLKNYLSSVFPALRWKRSIMKWWPRLGRIAMASRGYSFCWI